MDTLVSVIVGGALTTTGALASELARDRRARVHERDRDLREAVDMAVERLRHAEMFILLRDIRVRAYLANGKAEPFIALNDPTNAAVRDLLVAEARLRVRVYREPQLADALRTSREVLEHHRDLVNDLADTKRGVAALERHREAVRASTAAFVEEAGRALNAESRVRPLRVVRRR